MSLGLKQLVHCPTRGDAMLDLMFLSTDLTKSAYTQEILDGISAHSAVLLSLNRAIHNQSFVLSTFRDFLKADDVRIIERLSSNYDQFFALGRFSDVDALVARFESIVRSYIEQFVPLKLRKR